MSRVRQPRTIDMVARSPLTLVVLLGLCFLLGRSVYERFGVEREMAARLAETEAERAELQDRQTKLAERVEELQGANGVEAEIRRNFDVTKDGEQVVVIVEEETMSDPAAPTTTPPKQKPWYQFW